MYCGAPVWLRSFAVKCIQVQKSSSGGKSMREVAVWKESSRELQVCKITMTRHNTPSLIKHNSRMVGPQTSPERRVGKAGAKEEPVCTSPPTDGWEVLGWCVCVDFCIYCMCMCMGTWLSEEPISCSRLRRRHRAQRSRLFRFGGGTISAALPELAESISHL